MRKREHNKIYAVLPEIMHKRRVNRNYFLLSNTLFYIHCGILVRRKEHETVGGPLSWRPQIWQNKVFLEEREYLGYFFFAIYLHIYAQIYSYIYMSTYTVIYIYICIYVYMTNWTSYSREQIVRWPEALLRTALFF